MSYSDLLTDTCQVFHMKETTTSGEYGLPADKSYSYGTTADFRVSCYAVQDKGRVVLQSKDIPSVSDYGITEWTIHFPLGTDVRQGDRLIVNNQAFTALYPRTIRNHHMEVSARQVAYL